MMSKNRFILAISGAAILGSIIGGFVASEFWLHFYSRFNASGLLLRTQADIVTRISVLEDLRVRHVEDGAKKLELLLDGDLLTLDALAEKGQPFNASLRDALKREQEARAHSGYQPLIQMRPQVENAFRLLAEPANRPGNQSDQL